jgi:hypothetical protein
MPHPLASVPRGMKQSDEHALSYGSWTAAERHPRGTRSRKWTALLAVALAHNLPHRDGLSVGRPSG